MQGRLAARPARSDVPTDRGGHASEARGVINVRGLHLLRIVGGQVEVEEDSGAGAVAGLLREGRTAPVVRPVGLEVVVQLIAELRVIEGAFEELLARDVVVRRQAEQKLGEVLELREHWLSMHIPLDATRERFLFSQGERHPEHGREVPQCGLGLPRALLGGP